jgi:hypothetical protein
LHGARALAPILNSNLRHLCLARNKLGSDGLDELVQALFGNAWRAKKYHGSAQQEGDVENDPLPYVEKDDDEDGGGSSDEGEGSVNEDDEDVGGDFMVHRRHEDEDGDYGGDEMGGGGASAENPVSYRVTSNEDVTHSPDNINNINNNNSNSSNHQRKHFSGGRKKERVKPHVALQSLDLEECYIRGDVSRRSPLHAKWKKQWAQLAPTSTIDRYDEVEEREK